MVALCASTGTLGSLKDASSAAGRQVVRCVMKCAPPRTVTGLTQVLLLGGNTTTIRAHRAEATITSVAGAGITIETADAVADMEGTEGTSRVTGRTSGSGGTTESVQNRARRDTQSARHLKN